MAPMKRKRADRIRTELPDMVRLDVVIGTLSTQIPAEWLEDDKKMASVSKKLAVKVDAEIAKTIEKAKTEWRTMKAKK